MEPIAQRTVADLIVVLYAHDGLAHRHGRGVGAARCAIMGRLLADIEPAAGENVREFARRAREVPVIPVRVAGEHPAHHVVEIICPYAVEAPPALVGLLDRHGEVALVFAIDEDATAGGLEEVARAGNGARGPVKGQFH
jgi:hypothetical protein